MRMSPEEFSAEADNILTPAIERLIKHAFDNGPAQGVEIFIGAYLDLAKECALATVRAIIAEAGSTR